MAEREFGSDEPDHLGTVLTSYCFGQLTHEERENVERHLLDCDSCWREFQRLDAAVRTLRFDHTLNPGRAVHDAVALLGLSGRLDRRFGGHLSFVLGVAVLMGLEW